MGMSYCCYACELLSDLENGASLLPQSQSSKWDHLNQTNFLTELRELGFGQSHYRILIKGLVCASCTQLLERLPEIDSRILTAKLSFLTAELKLETENELLPSDIADLIERLGYEPQFLRRSERATDAHAKTTRGLLKRIAVAGFCFGNIMLLAISKYAGLDGELKRIFSLAEILLFLPILFYAAVPFYKGALTSIKRKSIHLDAIITTSLLLSFALSVVAYTLWNSELYLDSLAAFTFLILIGRWWIQKSEVHAKRRLSEGFFSQSLPVTIKFNNQTQVVPLSDVQIGDILLSERDQVLPCDGVLISESSAFDTGLLSGESIPRIYSAGMTLSAGVRTLSEKVEIRVTRTFKETDLYRVLEESDSFYNKKSRELLRLEKIGQIILSLALSLSFILFPIFTLALGMDFKEAWERILSLLVITCPCALAFGGPLSYAFALKKAHQKGILIATADVFDRLKNSKNIIFDKTGTLTTGLLRVSKTRPEKIPLWQQEIILSLESASHHPVAFAFRSHFEDVQADASRVQDLTEILGEKVFGIVDGSLYSLKKSIGAESEYIEVDFFKNETLLAKFFFEDQLRTESTALTAKLQNKFKVFICSGDRSIRAQKTGRLLNLPSNHVFGDLTPKDKMHFVSQHQPALMLGDGFNDAAALAAAEVGVAVEGALTHSIKNNDVCFLKPGLQPLVDLFEISNELDQTVKTNLRFTLFYNFTAGTFCILGFINPLAAAVLMPLSSAFVLFQSRRRFT